MIMENLTDLSKLENRKTNSKVLVINAQRLAIKAMSVDRKTCFVKIVRAKNTTLVHDGAKRQRKRRKKVRNHGKLILVIKAQLIVAAAVMVMLKKKQVIPGEPEHTRNILVENWYLLMKLYQNWYQMTRVTQMMMMMHLFQI